MTKSMQLVKPGTEEPTVSLAFIGGGEAGDGGARVHVNGKAIGDTDAVSFTLSDPHLPFESWVAIVRQFGRFNRWSRWALADALIFGEGTYGEKYAQASEATGLSPDTIKNIVYVAANVARSRRVPELGIGHHQEVASLLPREQRVWLKKAVAEEWSRDVLRSELRRAKAIAGDGEIVPGPKPGPGEMLHRHEIVESAAQRVWRESQPDGAEFRVPREAMVALGAALGEGE